MTHLGGWIPVNISPRGGGTVREDAGCPYFPSDHCDKLGPMAKASKESAQLHVIITHSNSSTVYDFDIQNRVAISRRCRPASSSEPTRSSDVLKNGEHDSRLVMG